MFASLKRQLPPTIKLALPMVITQLGQMAMGLVDTFMVGKLGPHAIGSVAVGTAVFFITTMFAAGLLSGLDHFISKATGEKDQEQADRWLLQGFYFSIALCIPLMVINSIIGNNLQMLGVPEITAHGSKEFLFLFNISVIPFILFFSQRTYLQATGFATTVTMVTLLGNVLNILMNWIFIYGHWGVQPMGIRGAALSTLINRSVMSIILIYLAYRKAEIKNWAVHWDYWKRIFKLGLPAAMQNLFEIGVFSLSTVLAARIDPMSLAAHSIVLNIASLTFMVPLGISFAAAIRVGFYLGEKKPKESMEAGYSALVLGFLVMAVSALLLVAFGRSIIALFTETPQVIDIGYKIIIIAAFFQVADGVQVVGAGALRGLGETRVSALANLFGHWAIGLPLAVYFCFYRSQGIVGLWTGLSVGLFAVALTLFVAWRRKDQLLCAPR